MTSILLREMDKKYAKVKSSSQKYSLGKIKKEIENEYDQIFKHNNIKPNITDLPYGSLKSEKIVLDKFNVDINVEINNK